MTSNQFSGDNERLPEADLAAFERATDIYRALIALVDARLDQVSDPAVAEQLRDDAQRYAAERRALSAIDRAGVQRVIDEYPALVRDLRDSLGS